MVDCYEVWLILRDVYGLFAGEKGVRLSSMFLSCILNETVLCTNFILSISESTWSFLHPRFTNHVFDCSRWLLSFSSVEQILLNLTTCTYAMDLLCTLLWHDCAWRYWVSIGLQFKSVSNLLPTFVTVRSTNLISVVEWSMVNLIGGCRLFIQLKSSFNFWEH